MGEKVKVSCEVADSFMFLNDLYKCDKDEILRDYFSFKGVQEGRTKALNEVTTEDFLKMVYIGYEVEETPEEKVRKKFQDYYEIACTTPIVNSQHYANGFTDGIRFFAYEYGIKIEGINK